MILNFLTWIITCQHPGNIPSHCSTHDFSANLGTTHHFRFLLSRWDSRAAGAHVVVGTPKRLNDLAGKYQVRMPAMALPMVLG